VSATFRHLERVRVFVRAARPHPYDLLGLKTSRSIAPPAPSPPKTLTYFPIAYLALRSMPASISTSYEEASFSLGGSRLTVTLPLVIPALANAFLLLFGCSLADFATPLILAGSDFSVLPTEAYLQITACSISRAARSCCCCCCCCWCRRGWYFMRRNGWWPAAPTSP
jgi:hypothetical protein